MLTRRAWLTLVPLAAVGLSSRRALASATPVAVPNNAVGALVVAVGGELVTVDVDDTLTADQVRIGTAGPLSITDRILLKGKGTARDRYLDDARNATKVGGNIKLALTDAMPAHTKTFETNHHAWARPFARKCVDWGKQLSALGLGRVRDDHGRVYLLEWAGATIDPAGAKSPAGLAKAPGGPSKPTLAAYESYIEALIGALT